MGTVLIKIPEETEFELFLDQWLLAVNYVQRPLEHAVPALRTDTLATVPCELTDEQAQTVRNNTVPAAIHFTEELDFLSEHDKDWIMGRAIVTRLGWA